jgi:hypothetical protein
MSDAGSMVLVSRVMAATEKVVHQALNGAWNEVPRTLEARRELLNQLSASAGGGDQSWLAALQQAVAESDSALQAMVPATPAVATEAPAIVGDGLHTALRQSLLGSSS